MKTAFSVKSSKKRVILSLGHGNFIGSTTGTFKDGKTESKNRKTELKTKKQQK